MYNWRLLLFAVVAFLQPIGSFTESNLIDGRQECCGYRSNSVTQKPEAYGSYRKTTPEVYRLSFREDIRKEQDHDARNDPITLPRERTQHRISSGRVKDSTETRVTREQERRLHNSVDSRESREAQIEQNRRTREPTFVRTRHSPSRYERNVLDSRRSRMTRDESRNGRSDNVRLLLYRDSLVFDDTQRVRNSQNQRRVFEFEDRRVTSERGWGDHRQWDQNRESRDRTNANRVDTTSAKHRRVIRDTLEREDRIKQNLRVNHNERINERRQQRDESRLSQKSTSYLRESSLSPSDELRRVLTRESRNLNVNIRSERTERSNGRRELGELRTSRDTPTERIQVSRVTEMLEITSRDEGLHRRDEIIDVQRKPLTRSLVRISVLRSTDTQRNSRGSERHISNERTYRYRKDVKSDERLDQRTEQRFDSQKLHRTVSSPRESRRSKQSQESRRSVSLTLESEDLRVDRKSRSHGIIQNNGRRDVYRKERGERRARREHSLNRSAHNVERKNNRESSRMTHSTERENEHIVNRKGIRGERFLQKREVRDENNVVMQRITSDVSEQRRHYDIRRISRSSETYAELRETRSSEHDRRNMLNSDKNTTPRVKTSQTGENQKQTREVRESSKDSRDIRDVRMGKKFEIRLHRVEIGSSKGQLLSKRQNLFAARSVEKESRNSNKMTKRSEKLSRSCDNIRPNERAARSNRALMDVESRRESRRVTEREVYLNRHNSAPRASRDETRLSSSDLVRAVRYDTRRDATFRNVGIKVSDIDYVEQASEKTVINWQVVLYTLQGAYLCGLLMQILTEKSNKDKSRYLRWWASSKNLVKVN